MAMAMASSSAAMARLNEHTRVHQKLNKMPQNARVWRAPYPYCNLTVDIEQPGTITPRGKPMFPIYTTVRKPGAAPQYIPYRESSRNVLRSQNGHYYQSRHWQVQVRKETSQPMVGSGPVYDENGRRVRPSSAQAGSGSRAQTSHGSSRGRPISRPHLSTQDTESGDVENAAECSGNERDRSGSEARRHGDSTVKRSKSYDLHRRARDKPATGMHSQSHTKLSGHHKKAIRTRSRSSNDVQLHHSDAIIKHLDNLSAKLKSGQQRSARRARHSSRSHSGGRRKRPSSAGPKREAHDDTVEAVIMQQHEQAALEQLSNSVCSKVDSQSSLGSSTEGCSLMSSSDDVGEKVIPFKPSAFETGAPALGSSRSDASTHGSDVAAVAPAPSKSPDRPVTAMSPGEAIHSLRLSTIKEARESIEERSMSSAVEGLFRKSTSSQRASTSHQTLLNQVSYEEDEEPLPTRRFSPSQRYEAASLIQAFVRGRFTRRRYLLHKAESESFEESLGNENDMVIVDIGEDESEDEEHDLSSHEEAKAESPAKPQQSSDRNENKENVCEKQEDTTQPARPRPKSASVYSVGHMYPKNDDRSEKETRDRIAEIQEKWRLGNVLQPSEGDEAVKRAVEKIAIGNISSIASAKNGVTGYATVRKDYSEFARRNRSRSTTRAEPKPAEVPNNATGKKVSKKAIDAFLDRMKQDFYRRMKAANGGSPSNLSGGEEAGRPQSTSGARRRAGTTEAALKRKTKKRPGSAAPRR